MKYRWWESVVSGLLNGLSFAGGVVVVCIVTAWFLARFTT